MSNLKLPQMTYHNLKKLQDITFDTKQLAYETTARMENVGEPLKRRIVIRYFNTDIATLWPNGDIRVTTGGYDTATTLRRITAVLRDNDTKVAVNIKNFGSYWSIRNTKVFKPFHTLTILHDGTILDSLSTDNNREVNR